MRHFLLTTCCLLLLLPANAQEEETENSDEEIATTSDKELGLDLNLSASTLGGTGGIGLKFGFLRKEKFILGPSIRYQHAWSNYNGVKSGFSVYGGGAFLHVRLYKYLFLGTEIELLSTPLQGGYITANRTWVPVALFGGGFSHAFSSNFRINAGIMYDVINNQNSPLRQGYFMRNKLNVPIPVIYRIAFFFPL